MLSETLCDAFKGQAEAPAMTTTGTPAFCARRDNAKRLSLGAGVLLERGLREYNICECDVKIKTGENGKPYLEEYPEIHFNLSHSGNMVFAVFSDREVGCDIEEIGKPQEKLEERFFLKDDYLMKIED